MVLILGGGLAGMSTAYHLGGAGCLVLESEQTPGGLCRSREVGGFVFDYTGHLLHLRDARFLRLVEEWLPGAFRVIERRAFVRSHGVTLPFPFQAHLHGLPREVVVNCVRDFVQSLATPVPEDSRTSFEQWALAVFGRGISEAFMLPYNRKVFGREPREMTAEWVSWAVPRPGLEEVLRGALGAENRGMGYNSTFRYPRRGGIGVLAATLAEKLGPCLRRGARVLEVDLGRRAVTLECGETLGYTELVVTVPLPSFLRMTRGGPAGLAAAAGRLDWSVVGCVNLGVDRPGLGDGAHWIYFPDSDVPFYRVGFPSNFSSTVAPPGTSSLYVEFGMNRAEPRDARTLEESALDGLCRCGILLPGDRVLLRDTVFLDPGYVIFDWARQQVMAEVVPTLARLGVTLIGRYGAWTYSYMERAVLDGLEAAEAIAGRRAVAGVGGAGHIR